MKIISEYVREQKRYKRSDLIRIFNLSTEEVNGFIKNLKSYGILKTVRNNSEQLELSDLIDEDIEVADEQNGDDSYLYVFTYVGIITIGRRIIKCYPKYILSDVPSIDEMKQVIKVITQYGSKEQIINLYNGDQEQSSFNLLATILFLLNDYHENGIYNNDEKIIEVNGSGEVLWDKTISDGFSLISNNRPYYLEYYTGKTVDDEIDFFKRLHECILTECSNQLEESNLLELFDLLSASLSEESLDDLGNTDYILYRLQSELNNEFNTRKQVLLKTMYAYIAQTRIIENEYGISIYGTNSFNLIWEDVCSEVLGNKLKYKLSQLELPIPLKDTYKQESRLIDIIEKPVWLGKSLDGTIFEKVAKDTLTPDLITINHQEDYQFIIMDAKYYNIQLESDKQLRGYPGVGDVTKQYLYELVYKEFLEDHDIKVIKNCFLMPIQSDKFINKGKVKLNIWHSLGLQDIQVIQLPVMTIYDYYLRHKALDISLLILE